MSHVYWMGKSKANTFSLCKVGGETGYSAQEDLKSVHSYNMGEGRTIRVWFFLSCLPRPSLVLCALSSLDHNIRHIWKVIYISASKESTCNIGDPGSVPGLERSPGEGNGNPIQYSGLVNSMDYMVHGSIKESGHNWATFTFILLLKQPIKTLISL